MTKRNAALTFEDSSADSGELTPALDLEQQIRERAYEIYEQRGSQDGSPEQDWLQAEAEILQVSALKAAA